MHGQNQEAEPATQHVEHSGMIGVAALRNELMNDKQYCEYLRMRASNDDPGLICAGGEQRQVEDAQAPSSPRPSANGNGNGKYRPLDGGDAAPPRQE